MATLTPQKRSGGRRSLKKNSPQGSFRFVGAKEAAELMAGGDTIVIEAGDCSEGHLGGAIHVDPSYFESGLDQSKYYPKYSCPEDGNLLPDRELHRALEGIGIAPETRVLVYGSGIDGTMDAARVAWSLLYAGVESVALLDGGIGAWMASGGLTAPVVKDVLDVAKRDGTLSSDWEVRRGLLASGDEVQEVVAGSDRSMVLVDVRRPEEWDGRKPHHYPFFTGTGHIPTALHQGDWRNLIAPQLNSLSPQLEKTRARWVEQGLIDPGGAAGQRALVFYCGTGWRSSVASLVAIALGLEAKNYDGGYFDWTFWRRG